MAFDANFLSPIVEEIGFFRLCQACPNSYGIGVCEASQMDDESRKISLQEN